MLALVTLLILGLVILTVTLVGFLPARMVGIVTVSRVPYVALGATRRVGCIITAIVLGAIRDVGRIATIIALGTTYIITAIALVVIRGVGRTI